MRRVNYERDGLLWRKHIVLFRLTYLIDAHHIIAKLLKRYGGGGGGLSICIIPAHVIQRRTSALYSHELLYNKKASAAGSGHAGTIFPVG